MFTILPAHAWVAVLRGDTSDFVHFNYKLLIVRHMFLFIAFTLFQECRMSHMAQGFGNVRWSYWHVWEDYVTTRHDVHLCTTKNTTKQCIPVSWKTALASYWAASCTLKPISSNSFGLLLIKLGLSNLPSRVFDAVSHIFLCAAFVGPTGNLFQDWNTEG